MTHYTCPQKSIAIIFNDAKMLLNFRKELIISLIKNNFDVFCLCPTFEEAELSILSSIGAKCYEFYLERNGIHPLNELRSLTSLKNLLCQINPTILLSITAKPIVWGLLASRLTSIRYRVVLFTGLGYVFTSGNQKAKFLKPILVNLYRIALPLANKIIFQNQDDCQEITHLCGLDQKKVQVIQGTGVNLQEWFYHPPHLSPLTFTLAARLLKEKGILEFCAAAAYLKQYHPDVRFWLLGGPDKNPGTLSEKDIEQYIQSGVVEWFGFVNVKEYLSQTSVFVLPSYREGVPRSIQEAMAMGRPVITTDVPGCRETVIDGYNGYLIPPRDVDALITAMHKFIEQPSLIFLMGYHSYQMAVELFDVKKINAQYLQLFSEDTI